MIFGDYLYMSFGWFCGQSWMYKRKDEIQSQRKGTEIVCRIAKGVRTKSVRKNWTTYI